MNKVHFKDFDFGFAVGENGVILRTITGGEPATLVENENQSPYSFELFQNYPNPFNPTTTMSFVIGHRSFVTLKVYDVLGNEVATLVNEELSAGEYEVEFSSHSDKGQNLPSGVYFYQLHAGGSTNNSHNGQGEQAMIQTKKMILLK